MLTDMVVDNQAQHYSATTDRLSGIHVPVFLPVLQFYKCFHRAYLLFKFMFYPFRHSQNAMSTHVNERVVDIFSFVYEVLHNPNIDYLDITLQYPQITVRSKVLNATIFYFPVAIPIFL